MLLCRRHHRSVHEEGYRVEHSDNGAFHFYRPDGQRLPESPAPTAVPTDPADELRLWNEASGLQLHARTTRPHWLGERLDVGWALDVLHPAAVGGPEL